MQSSVKVSPTLGTQFQTSRTLSQHIPEMCAHPRLLLQYAQNPGSGTCLHVHQERSEDRIHGAYAQGKSMLP